ncbi:MAG: hypothetical protein J6S67_04240 [Methanobrevibacter sp.]|nr:hypothetical protein [Methanobrevibacter sp.]
MYNVGFVPSMYIDATICDNREKRERSAKRNYQRMVYESVENNTDIKFGGMLDDEMRKISKFDKYEC